MKDKNPVNLNKLEDLIYYKFKNADLLKESLTHRSYLNENSKWPLPHNERLEFLGDAVLELAITEILFEKYPKYDEGKLTAFRAALVNYLMLASVAKDIQLEKFLLLSRGEAKDKGRARDVILANAFEALIGAVYLDSDYQVAKDFVSRFVAPRIKDVIEQELYKDAKSFLQERTQAYLKLTPVYKVLNQEGPDHKKVFKVGVYFGDKLMAEGEGLSKQEAEVDAAKKALGKI
ncbi:MAG: ribonuclease III, partial [Parcubacteria group bacterium Athens0714_26]